LDEGVSAVERDCVEAIEIVNVVPEQAVCLKLVNGSGVEADVVAEPQHAITSGVVVQPHVAVLAGFVHRLQEPQLGVGVAGVGPVPHK